MLTPGRLLDAQSELTDRGKAWVHGLQLHYAATPIEPAEAPWELDDFGGFKLM